MRIISILFRKCRKCTSTFDNSPPSESGETCTYRVHGFFCWNIHWSYTCVRASGSAVSAIFPAVLGSFVVALIVDSSRGQRNAYSALDGGGEAGEHFEVPWSPAFVLAFVLLLLAICSHTYALRLAARVACTRCRWPTRLDADSDACDS